ncbi:Primary amine oxidase [Hibiscus syriacus]|uniref:Amine oxidase n=1 Tax=Hibiscus syriacus TaxID=106335 RepID=A0A6A3B1K2_HIBSY|nr:Primary amine oxidase [Hibiscus syriacus]
MESKSFRFLFSFIIIAFLLHHTWTHLPYAPPPDLTTLIDCATNSHWCTSKNRFQSKQPTVTKEPGATISHRSRCHESAVPRHPLDPLTVLEFNKVRSILSFHALFNSSNNYAFHSVVLEEPDKDLVRKWEKGQPLFPRIASVVARANGVSHVLTVNLETDEVNVRNTAPLTGYPTMTIEDMTSSSWAPLSDAEFNHTIIQRGVNLDDLACLPISLGWFGKKEENRRLIKVQCYSMKDTANFYMKPIEGLTVLLDMDTKEVVEISDTGRSIPIPKATNTDYRFSEQKKLQQELKLINPISIEQPKGPSFIIEDEHLVKWANWEFHLKPDPRAGVVISRAKVRDLDGEVMRDVMYKGFTSELFVPYMDPTDAWYFKTYMDAGAYGFGLQAMPLDSLNDCPRNAYYMDVVFAAGDGVPYVRSNMICVFDRYAGDIGWRHAESPITGMEVRSSPLSSIKIEK